LGAVLDLFLFPFESFLEVCDLPLFINLRPPLLLLLDMSAPILLSLVLLAFFLCSASALFFMVSSGKPPSLFFCLSQSKSFSSPCNCIFTLNVSHSVNSNSARAASAVMYPEVGGCSSSATV
jgi:hypothetical protein